MNLAPAPAFTNRFKQYQACKSSGIDWLGEIPTHWELTTLKRIASIKYGLGEPPQLLANGLAFIRATNVMRGRIVEEGMQFVDAKDVPWNRDPILRTGDIIVVRSGAYTGDSAIIPAEYDGAIAGYDMVVTSRPGHARFLAWTLLSRYVLEAQIELKCARAAQPHLNAEELGSLLILKAPESEQSTIVSFLDRETARIDALVSKKERLIELLQEKRTALITRAVTKGLDPGVPLTDSRVEWLGEIPTHWEVGRVKDVMLRIEQGWSPLCENRQADGHEWGVLKVGCVNNEDFDETQHKALPADLDPLTEYEVKLGDILISRANTRQLLGSAVLVRKVRAQLLLCDKLYRIRVRDDRVSREFMVRAFASAVTRFQLEREATGASASMQNVSQEMISDVVLPLPPPREQRAIAACLDRETAKLDDLIAKVREAIDRLREFRIALISAAVTGKIDVRDVGP